MKTSNLKLSYLILILTMIWQIEKVHKRFSA